MKLMNITTTTKHKNSSLQLHPPDQDHPGSYQLALPDHMVHICSCCDEAFLSLDEVDLLSLYLELRQYLKK